METPGLPLKSSAFGGTPRARHPLASDMASTQQGEQPSDKQDGGVDLGPILKHLGNGGRYQVIQQMLNIFASFLYAIPVMDSVFTGYQPDYQCSQVDNVTQLEEYLPDGVTNVTLHDVQYQQCSIDVTVNTSGTSSTLSLPCVAGVNFSMPSYTSFLTEWSLVCDKAGLTQLSQTAVFGGQAAGYLLFSILADRYGRKKVYIPCAFCCTTFLVASALVPTYHYFLVCKIIVGFSAIGMVHAAYTMFMELLPQQWRSLASLLDTVLWTCSCLSMAAVAYCMQGRSWRHLGLVIYSAYALTLLLPCFLDESLRWLVASGEIEEAEKILRKACRMNGKDFGKIQAMLHQQIFANNTLHDQSDDSAIRKEIESRDKAEVGSEKTNSEVKNKRLTEDCTNVELTDDACTEAKETGFNHDSVSVNDCDFSGDDPLMAHDAVFYVKYTLLDLCRHRVVLVPFFVCLFVWMTTNLYYYAVMLGSARLFGNRLLNFALLNLQEIPAVLLALFLERRFNRRPLAFFYGMGAAVFLLVSVGLVALGGEAGATLSLATAAQYVGMFSLTGTYFMLFIYIMEVFPTTMRAVGTGTVGALDKIFGMASPFLVLWAEDTPWAPGVLVGCLCCLASLSIWLLPETRHRGLPDTLQEIQAWSKESLPLGADVKPQTPPPAREDLLQWTPPSRKLDSPDL
ncbi:hypothetical protein ACOMHN_034649 [Nucella lapillus]